MEGNLWHSSCASWKAWMCDYRLIERVDILRIFSFSYFWAYGRLPNILPLRVILKGAFVFYKIPIKSTSSAKGLGQEIKGRERAQIRGGCQMRKSLELMKHAKSLSVAINVILTEHDQSTEGWGTWLANRAYERCHRAGAYSTHSWIH